MQYLKYTEEFQVRELIEHHNRNSKYVAMDVETTGLDPFTDKLVSIIISGPRADSAVSFPPCLVHLLRNLDSILILHNYKFDFKFLYKEGVDLRSKRVLDTMLIHHLIDENAEHSLDSIVQHYFRDNYKEIFWGKYKAISEAPEDEQLEYECKDVIYTLKIFEIFKETYNPRLVEHSHRLAKSLLDTEINGIKVDLDYITEAGVRLKSEIETLKREMQSQLEVEIEMVEYDLWLKALDLRKTPKGKKNVPKPEFSFDSNKQLASLLYEQLGLPVQTNEKTRSITVDDNALEKLESAHPVITGLRRYRETNKVLTTFIDGTLQRVRNERIYPSFNINGTVTGRISHSNPNLGQLPSKGGIRGIYIPDPGNVLLSVDFEQLEVCLEANLTKDINLIKIFTEGLSKHDITAEKLNIPRSTAKTVNFALQYWASHFKISKLLGISESEALKIWNNYWALYSGPKKLKAKTDAMVDSGTPLVTPFGRVRHFDVRKRHPWDSDYRQAYNFMIQSPGADLTSRAFYLISEWLKETGYGRPWFTVHDEILVECRKEHFVKIESKLLEIMVSVGDTIGLEIPLKASSSGQMVRWED